MKLDLLELRSQLSPGWSPVNIVLLIVLAWLALPLGLIMLAYILWGDRAGLDFSQPGSFGTFLTKVKNGFHGAVDGFTGKSDYASNRSTGTPIPDRDSFDAWRERERKELQAEREKLERERRAFEAEKETH